MRAVAGLTIVQALAACLFAGLRHNRYRFVSRRLVAVMGPGIFASSLVGALLSKHVSNGALLALFAALALPAAGLMLLPLPREDAEVAAEEIAFSSPFGAAIAVVVGFLGGMVGQGGSFILIPLMLYVLRVPTRVTIGSNLGIVFFSSVAGLIGKASTGQIALWPAVALVLGAVPGALLGSHLSKRTRPRFLRYGLAAVVGLTTLRICWQLVA